MRRTVELALLAGLVLAGAGAIVGYAAFRIWEQGEVDDRRPVDAIVVLGAAHHEGTPSAVFAARLDHAVELYGEGLAPYLVVTGGRAPGDRVAEADAARAYATRHGVPEAAILSEDEASDTLGSIQAVARLLREHDLRSALFVSDRMHMLRVLRMASDSRIEAYGSPTRTSPADSTLERQLRSLGHELGGLASYLLIGR